MSEPQTVLLVPISDPLLESHLDGLLTPAQQRILAAAWSEQPTESMSWAIDAAQLQMSLDPALGRQHLWLPLTPRRPRNLLQRLYERLTLSSRWAERRLAGMSLEAAALAFRLHHQLTDRQFDLLTAPYRVGIGIPTELGLRLMDAHAARLAEARSAGLRGAY